MFEDQVTDLYLVCSNIVLLIGIYLILSYLSSSWFRIGKYLKELGMLNSSSERELITAWRGINASPLTGYNFFSGAWLRTGKYLRELDITTLNLLSV